VSSLDDMMYAMAFVAEFNRLHSLGVHAQFRLDYADVGERVERWERWCADLAIDTAKSMVQIHRKAKRSHK